jgi:hypothetical protein
MFVGRDHRSAPDGFTIVVGWLSLRCFNNEVERVEFGFVVCGPGYLGFNEDKQGVVSVSRELRSWKELVGHSYRTDSFRPVLEVAWHPKVSGFMTTDVGQSSSHLQWD